MKLIDKLLIITFAYLQLSQLAFIGWIYIGMLVSDNNNTIVSYLGLVSFINLILICPLFIIAGVILGAFKLRGIFARRKAEAEKAKEATAQNAALKDAEEDLDVWTQFVLLKSPDASARISAIRMLRSRGTPDVVEELAKAMYEDGDVSVRYEAYLALKFQGKDTMGLLLERLKAEGDTKKKLGLLELLMKTGDMGQVGTLAYLYSFETDKDVKLGILDALGKFNRDSIRDLLIYILRNEEDKDVRQKAIGLLCSYDDASAQDALKRLLGDPDGDIRDSADKSLKAMELKV